MSEIIVKNLPDKITNEEVTKHFHDIGTITNVNLKYKDGKFRQYAFVGFKSPEEANEAFKKLNGTYIKTFKLQIEICKGKIKGDTFKKKAEDQKEHEHPETASDQPQEKQKWEKLFVVKIKTKEQNTNDEKKGKTLTKPNLKMFLKPLKYKSLRIPRKLSYIAYVGFETEKQMNQFLLKDKSFLDGVRVRIHKYNNEPLKRSQMGDAPWRAAEEKLQKVAEPIENTGKIFVRNLWYSTTEQDLKKLFEKIGPVADISLPICKATRKLKGFAHISFLFPEHALKAYNELDGTSFQGRLLHILPSLTKEDEELDNLNIKEKKKKELKKSWNNWNSLFLGPGAVVDLLSEKLGRSKQEIFRNEDGRNTSVAATLALGEAQIVEENRKCLENEGVSLEAFSNHGMQRSSTILLAKNLSAHTTALELKTLFSRYGELGRVVLPPSGVTGIIEFLNPTEAKIAYNALAYSRFKHLPLYLEWAPIQTFKTEYTTKEKSAESETGNENPSSSITGTPEANTTLYVKNLNFESDEKSLKAHFSKIGPVYSVRIALKRCLSQGYGFVQYYKSKDAKTALSNLQGSQLDGHDLSLKYSEKTLIPEALRTAELSEVSTKLVPVIMVKNIPFESSLSEVKEVFKTFGEISSIRLPHHMESEQHRGFCFVEFSHLESAKNAFAALSFSTHLRGRRLVLEWAKDSESVEELRKRTAEHFLDGGISKRRKKVDISDKKNDVDE